jgi:hypothetical protein
VPSKNSSLAVAKPQPRPARRVRDPELLRRLHLEWRSCALAVYLNHHEEALSLHHVSKHPRDDVRGNLVMLCGHGTAGCHGLIEAGDDEVRYQLGRHVIAERRDIIQYVQKAKGSRAGNDWLARNLFINFNG